MMGLFKSFLILWVFSFAGTLVYSQSLQDVDGELTRGNWNQALELAESALKLPGSSTVNSFKSKKVEALNWLYRQNAAGGSMSQALEVFLKMKSSIMNDNYLKGQYGAWDLTTEETILRQMGSLKKTAAPIYRLTVVFLDETQAEAREQSGQSPKRVNWKLDERAEARTRLYFEYQKHFAQVLSQGRWSWEIRYERPGLTLGSLLQSSLENEFDALGLTPQKKAQEFFFNTLNDTDVYIFIWPKGLGAPATALGGDHPDDFFLSGWSGQLRRGMVSIPDSWVVSFETRNTLIHEVFHTVERNLGLGAFHNWFPENRTKVPQWKGQTELEYYQWRFAETLPQYGWDQINYRKRFPLFVAKADFPTILNHWITKPSETPQKILDKTRDLLDNELFAQAKSTLNQLLAFWPHHYEGQQVMAEILAQEGNAQAAMTQWETILGWGSEYGYRDYWVNFGALNAVDILQNGEDSPQREKLLLWRTKVLPDSTYGFRTLGQFYLDQKDFPKAQKNFERALELNPDSWQDLVGYGQALYLLGERDRAQNQFEKAFQNYPRSAKSLADFYRNIAYEVPSQKEKEALFLKGLGFNPEDGWGHRGLAFVYQALGQKELALSHFKKSADFGVAASLKTLTETYKTNYLPQSPKPSPPSLRVAIYSPYSSEPQRWFRDAFEGFKHIQVVYITASEIQKGILKGFDALILPGGMALDYFEPLGEKGAGNIRDFVNAGGAYLGLCAGAYCAVSPKLLNLGGFEAFNMEYWFRGNGQVQIELSAKGQGIFQNSRAVQDIRYANGPLYQSLESLPDRPYEVLATYKTGMANFGAPDIMVGRPAIITFAQGKGRVILSSPHPEYTYGKEHWVRLAVEWMVKNRSF